MNVSKLDIEDYCLEQTLLEPGTTTHLKAGSAATDQIGSWVRKRTLGQGSSGVVFLQEHTTSRALRAVKILRIGDQETIPREIRSMLFLKIYRRLFVDFLAWYFVDTTYIAMEYVSGGDLLAYIGRVGPLEEGEAKGHIIPHMDMLLPLSLYRPHLLPSAFLKEDMEAAYGDLIRVTDGRPAGVAVGTGCLLRERDIYLTN